MGAFVHVTQTAVAAVALLIVVSMIWGGSFADVVGGGGGPPPTRVGMERAPSAGLWLMLLRHSLRVLTYLAVRTSTHRRM